MGSGRSRRTKTPIILILGISTLILIGIVIVGVGIYIVPRVDERLQHDQRERLSQENLKELAGAVHKYTRQHNGQFPAAVQSGPNGRTLHSWRVAILPFLNRKELYDQYRFDEPWDSPANRKVLEQMPDLFRSPFDDDDSTNSGYYVVTGRRTLFYDGQRASIVDILDGTKNTLMIVESKQNVPWTQPEDIPFDPNRPAPKLGGFMKGRFAFATADGEPHIVSQERIKGRLKFFIMRDDLQPAAVLSGEVPPIERANSAASVGKSANTTPQPREKRPEIIVGYAPGSDEFESTGRFTLSRGSREDYVYIANAGDDTLVLSRHTLPEGFGCSGELTKQPVQLAPSESTWLKITDRGHKSISTFTIFSNDPDEQEFVLRLMPRQY